MRRIERVRLYPTTRQRSALRFMLDVSRDLYNAALQERRDAYRSRGISVSGRMQYSELTALRRYDTRVAAVYREVEDAALHRLDLAMQAFFRRCKRGDVPGFPRFKTERRWKHLMFPHGARALAFDAARQRVRVPGVGSVKFRKGRMLPESFGRGWVVERNERWYLCVEYAVPTPQKKEVCDILGLDFGVHVLIATSDGALVRNAAIGWRRSKRTARLQRELELATKKDATGRCINRNDRQRLAAVKRLARSRECEANARRDHAHKVARKLVDSASCIAVENLSARSMTRSAKGSVMKPGTGVRAKSALNRRILDSGFALLQRMIAYKAESAGVTVVAVDARFSSQTCAKCGHCERGNRRRRRFACLQCSFATHADVAAALEIRRRAELLLSSEPYPGEEPGRCARRAA